MNKLTLPSALEKALTDYYTAPQPDANFALHLEEKLMAQGQNPPAGQTPRQKNKRPTIFMQTLRAKPAFVLFLLLLALTLLSGVVYALGKVAGYFPGWGFTEDSAAVYLLSEPVESSENGITLRVEGLFLSAEETRLRLLRTPGGELPVVLFLRDAQNREYAFLRGESKKMDSLSRETYTFSPLPLVTELTLVYRLTDSAAPMELPLRLRPAQSGDVLSAVAGGLARASQSGLTLRLESAARAANFTVLEISLAFERPALPATDWNVILSDAQGRLYPLQELGSTPENGRKTYRAPALPGQTDFVLTLTAFPDPHSLQAVALDTGQLFTVSGEWRIFWRSPEEWNTPQPDLTLPVTPGQPLPVDPPAPSLPADWQAVADLAERYDASWRQSAGWIHYVTQTETYPAPGVTFPPPILFTEQWLEVDAQGWVLRSVYTDRDADGSILQQSLGAGSYGLNLTTGEFMEDNGLWQFSADWLTSALSATAQSGALVTVLTVPCPGAEEDLCWQLSAGEEFSAPVQNPGESVSFDGVGRHIWVRQRDGASLRQQAFWRLQDGTERMDYTVSLLTLEKAAEPPREVLELLKKLVLP